MEKLYDLKDKLCEELEEYARKQDMGAGDLYVRVHYSRDGGGNYNGGQGGYSSRRGGGRGGRGGYSREDGRSEMMEHLEMAMDSATDQDRETIKRFMRQLEQA